MSTLISNWVSFDTLSGTRHRISEELINLDASRLEYPDIPPHERRIVLNDGRQYIARNIRLERQEEPVVSIQKGRRNGA
ncbi:hypothetical protein KCE64_005150 [Salmonella enterica subsp. enterica serovar Hvittingfoss]|nr:hypothetical protein [Salmonella enterica subsp. enterica serovar Hvittingfoss]EHL2852616.1 hypothetical protein [Salmonella enterica subsp. enterica serovar Hvittingfoss]